MARARSVLVTANFDRSLAGRLATEVIPNLQRFPELGADFLARAPLSVDGQVLFEEVVKAAGAGSRVRYLIDGDYVILYLVKGGALHLLAIKHHRQLSFDFGGHWP